jgi:hypothetical protein
MVERVHHEVDEGAQSVGHRLIVFDMVLDRRGGQRHGARMPSWSDFAGEAPELAEKVRVRLDAHVHKTIATLRRDGSPRISGTETKLVDGELWIGSMWQALKARDLQRDPRFALHSGSDDPPEDPTTWTGDAKIAGVAEEITDPALVEKHNGGVSPGPSHLFRLDVHEASVVAINDAGNAIVIEIWRPGQPVRRIERE